MADAMNMSLDEIIKQNKQQQRTSRSRGRGGGDGGNTRGRGGGNMRGNVRGRGGVRGRGRGGGRGRGRGQSRSGTPGPRQGRSLSRGPNNGYRSRSQSRARSRSRARSQSRARSRSRQGFFYNRSRSGSRVRGLTPRGRAGLEELLEMPQLVTNRRGGMQTRLRRSNSNPNLQNGSVHSRLGVTTRRGAAYLRSPLGARGMARGVSKRGRGFTTANRYSNIGLRSDQILREQQLINSIIKSQTFRRSRNNSFNASQLTVSVANDFNSRRRRNSVGNAGYLDRQSLAQLNNQFGGYFNRRGPGSVKSMGSNRSNRSNKSYRSNQSNRSNRSSRSNRSNRSRGRGRGGNRGVGRKFVNKQILNPKLQKEIAAIQGKGASAAADESPAGVNFTPTPSATTQTLHQRFASK